MFFKIVSIASLSLISLQILNAKETINHLPQEFYSTLSGTDAPIAVSGKTVVSAKKGAPAERSVSLGSIEDLSFKFLNLFTGEDSYYGTAELTVYKIQAEEPGKKIWATLNGTTGKYNQEKILSDLSKELRFPGECKAGFDFEKESLVDHLAQVPMKRFTEAADILIRFVSHWVESTFPQGKDYYLSSAVSPVYSRFCQIGDFSSIQYKAFFVDATPSQYSDDYIYLVLFTDLYDE